MNQVIEGHTYNKSIVKANDRPGQYNILERDQVINSEKLDDISQN